MFKSGTREKSRDEPKGIQEEGIEHHNLGAWTSSPVWAPQCCPSDPHQNSLDLPGMGEMCPFSSLSEVQGSADGEFWGSQ